MGRREKKEKRKQVNKRHIILVVFSLLLCFGAFSSNISAYTVENSDGTTSEYKYYITYRGDPAPVGGKYRISYYYFNDPVDFKYLTDNHWVSVSSNHDSAIAYWEEQYTASDKLVSVNWYTSLNSMFIRDSAINNYPTFFKTNYQPLYDFYNTLNEDVQRPELTAPPTQVEELLNLVNLIPVLLIIVGSMVFLVGLVIGLRVLVRELRRVSRV